jgi:hypothetical protein
MGHITFKGKIFALSGPEGDGEFMDLANELAESMRKYLIRKFEDSVQLAIVLGTRIDQEAIRAIVRSIKVNIESYETFKFSAMFKDDYSHWYAGQVLPDDISELLQNIMNEGIREWINEGEPKTVMAKALNVS